MAAGLWALDARVLEYVIDRLEVRGEQRAEVCSGFPGQLSADTTPRSLIRLKRAGLINGAQVAENEMVLVVTRASTELKRPVSGPDGARQPSPATSEVSR